MNDPQATGAQTVTLEMIGTKAMEQDTDPTQLEHLVVQVSKMNTHNIHREIRSHASDAENKDISTWRASYQRYTATTAEHQTTAQKLVKDTTTPTAAHQTAIAARATTQHHPQHRPAQTDCSHPRKLAPQYSLPYQKSTQKQQTSPRQ